MGDRGEMLRRLLLALERPGVDGVMATADVVEDLALLGALDEKLVFGSMNRGGLAGSIFELDDRFSAYTSRAIAENGLDGGKMMVRIANDHAATASMLAAAAEAINELAAKALPALIEVFASRVEGGRAVNIEEPAALIRAVHVASGLGETSAYTWLKLPVVAEMAEVMKATSLPTVLLGGDPGSDADLTFMRWEAALKIPQVIGLVAGRALLYPVDGDVARAVDDAATIVQQRVKDAT